MPTRHVLFAAAVLGFFAFAAIGVWQITAPYKPTETEHAAALRHAQAYLDLLAEQRGAAKASVASCVPVLGYFGCTLMLDGVVEHISCTAKHGCQPAE